MESDLAAFCGTSTRSAPESLFGVEHSTRDPSDVHSAGRGPRDLRANESNATPEVVSLVTERNGSHAPPEMLTCTSYNSAPAAGAQERPTLTGVLTALVGDAGGVSGRSGAAGAHTRADGANAWTSAGVTSPSISARPTGSNV
eukprot:2165840-Prymnesium_polylepis.1